MKQSRIDEIKMWSDQYDDLPDGAYFAILENEHGITPEDVAEALPAVPVTPEDE